MEFTEHEMTAAVDAVAQRLFAATRPPWRRGPVAAAWESLPPVKKYQHRAAVAETVLPALRALPDRPTVAAPPVFTDEEYEQAAAVAHRSLADRRGAGAWEALPERRRRRQVRATAALARDAVAAMPVRQDPDDLPVEGR